MQVVLFLLFFFTGCHTFSGGGAEIATSFVNDRDPLQLDSVTVSVNQRKNQMRLFFDPRTNLVDVSVKVDDNTYLTAVFTEEIRSAIIEVQKSGGMQQKICLFGWGNLKITVDPRSFLTIIKIHGNTALHFKSMIHNRDFTIFVDDGAFFANLLFQENLQTAAEEAEETEETDF